MTHGDRECEKESDFICDNWLVVIDEQLNEQLLLRGYDSNTMLLHAQDFLKFMLIRQGVIEMNFANWHELVAYTEAAIIEIGKTSVQEIAVTIAGHSFEFHTSDPATIDCRAGGRIRIRVRRPEQEED